MKQPKNQKELLQILAEQDVQLSHQEEQIRVLKQALLRLEQEMRKTRVLAERAQGTNRQLNERLKVTEFLLKRNQN
jgi:hypothetical protein